MVTRGSLCCASCGEIRCGWQSPGAWGLGGSGTHTNTPDIIRNLKAKYTSLQKEKCDLSKEMQSIQTSMRATRVAELEKENHVLMTEVARLRRMQDCVNQKMIARNKATGADMLALQRAISELQLERKRCLCIPGFHIQDGNCWTRKPGGTVAELRGRSRLAHDAIEHTVKCCKHVLCSDGIDSGSHAKQEVMQLLKKVASRHDMLHSQLCSLTKKGRDNDFQAAQQQPAQKACKIRGPRQRGALVAKPAEPSTQTLLADAENAIKLLLSSMRGLPVEQFLRSDDLQQRARSLGKVVTAFVHRHMELDPTVQKNTRACGTVTCDTGSESKSATDSAPADMACTHVHGRGARPEIAVESNNGPAAIDQTMQSLVDRPARCSSGARSGGFFGQASLLPRAEQAISPSNHYTSLLARDSCGIYRVKQDAPSAWISDQPAAANKPVDNQMEALRLEQAGSESGSHGSCRVYCQGLAHDWHECEVSLSPKGETVCHGKEDYDHGPQTEHQIVEDKMASASNTSLEQVDISHLTTGSECSEDVFSEVAGVPGDANADLIRDEPDINAAAKPSVPASTGRNINVSTSVCTTQSGTWPGSLSPRQGLLPPSDQLESLTIHDWGGESKSETSAVSTVSCMSGGHLEEPAQKLHQSGAGISLRKTMESSSVSSCERDHAVNAVLDNIVDELIRASTIQDPGHAY
eukprot:jgi/Ulvmu1/3375/UM156_0032.1